MVHDKLTAKTSGDGDGDASSDEENSQTAAKRRRMEEFKLQMPERASTGGHVLVCGQGDFGQLGLGDDFCDERKRLTLLPGFTNVVDISAGGVHNLILLTDGRVYSFGCNDEGALGRSGSEGEPRLVVLPARALKITAGDSHSACLLVDGRVFAWGSFRDSTGSIGLTARGIERLPVDVWTGMVFCDISSGSEHIVLLNRDGKVYTMGAAEQGQLGRVSLRTARGGGRRGKEVLLTPGEVVFSRSRPTDAIWATRYCTFVRETLTNAIWAFGLNNYRQLIPDRNEDLVFSPTLTDLEDVKAIAGGQHHTVVIKNDGQCCVVGRSEYGRLGLGAMEEDIVQEYRQVESLAKQRIARISCGDSQSFAVTDDGKGYSWGMGTNCQLGNGTEIDIFDPMLVKQPPTSVKPFLRISGGGQHTLFLVEGEPINKANAKNPPTSLPPATVESQTVVEKSATAE